MLLFLFIVCIYLESDLVELGSRFSAQRSLFPPLCIVTSFDRLNSVFTKSKSGIRNKPNLQILARLIQLCTKGLEVAESQLMMAPSPDLDFKVNEAIFFS